MDVAISHNIKADTELSPWQGFNAGLWQKEINVRDFIQQNYCPYEGDGSFLAPATPRTREAWNPDGHRRITGADIDAVLEFGRRLAARHKSVWLRFVLVPGLTDDPSEISHIAEFAAGLGNVERVDVLPFHQMGRFKWKELKI